MKDLTIIIVNWNTKDLLRDCLKSIYKETKKITFDVIVVDNNSTDNSALMVKREFPDVKLIANEDNKGFAKANNQALKISDSKNILLLNPDTVVLNNAIEKMTKYLWYDKCDIVTCKLLNTDGSLQKSVGSFYSFWKTLIENRFTTNLFNSWKSKKNRSKLLWDHNEVAEIDWARGAVIMFTTKVLVNVGLLDERFFIYGEEIDFFRRAKSAGFKSLFIPDAEIIHHGKCSSMQRKAEMFIQNYKSFYLFLKKHYKSYSYLLYRARVYIYLFIWTFTYYMKMVLTKTSKRNYFKEQFSVYSKTLVWHFTKESMIR